jgi:succinate-acetate transporter protein
MLNDDFTRRMRRLIKKSMVQALQVGTIVLLFSIAIAGGQLVKVPAQELLKWDFLSEFGMRVLTFYGLCWIVSFLGLLTTD